MLRARRLNKRLVIEKPVTVQDDIGGPTTTWAEHVPVWGDIRYLSGLESVKANAEVATSKASIRIRYRKDLLPTFRVRYGTTIFAILAIQPDEQDMRHMDLVCETGASS